MLDREKEASKIVIIMFNRFLITNIFTGDIPNSHLIGTIPVRILLINSLSAFSYLNDHSLNLPIGYPVCKQTDTIGGPG